MRVLNKSRTCSTCPCGDHLQHAYESNQTLVKPHEKGFFVVARLMHTCLTFVKIQTNQALGRSWMIGKCIQRTLFLPTGTVLHICEISHLCACRTAIAPCARSSASGSSHSILYDKPMDISRKPSRKYMHLHYVRVYQNHVCFYYLIGYAWQPRHQPQSGFLTVQTCCGLGRWGFHVQESFFSRLKKKFRKGKECKSKTSR